MNKIYLDQIINQELAGFRLDQALAQLFPQFSRSQMQQWLEQGHVTVDKIKALKCKQRVFPGQLVEINILLADKDDWQPQEIPLNLVFEDEFLLVINKPPGLVVHPGAGNLSATLVNALLHYDPTLKKIPRAGLIHRLDKDTSGLLLVARTLTAHHYLTQQMQQRLIHRSYLAIVTGHPRQTGTISACIGRHPTQRTKMAVLSHGGKTAITHYKILEKFPGYAYLEIELETGRTHQIRVHMTHIEHPILGDPVYGKPKNFPQLPDELRKEINAFKRQALHARKISFRYPVTEMAATFEAPLPADFANLLQAFRQQLSMK